MLLYAILAAVVWITSVEVVRRWCPWVVLTVTKWIFLAYSGPAPISWLRSTPMMLPASPHPLHGHLLGWLVAAPSINSITLNNQILLYQSPSLIYKISILADNCSLLHLLLQSLSLSWGSPLYWLWRQLIVNALTVILVYLHLWRCWSYLLQGRSEIVHSCSLVLNCYWQCALFLWSRWLPRPSRIYRSEWLSTVETALAVTPPVPWSFVFFILSDVQQSFLLFLLSFIVPLITIFNHFVLFFYHIDVQSALFRLRFWFWRRTSRFPWKRRLRRGWTHTLLGNFSVVIKIDVCLWLYLFFLSVTLPKVN